MDAAAIRELDRTRQTGQQRLRKYAQKAPNYTPPGTKKAAPHEPIPPLECDPVPISVGTSSDQSEVSARRAETSRAGL
jgi:hypothetical protein